MYLPKKTIAQARGARRIWLPAAVLGGLIVAGLAVGDLTVAKAQNSPPAVAPNPADPLYRQTGEHGRTYAFPETGETIPYHLFVPSTWTPQSRMPLVIVLHGGGQQADKPFEHGDGILAKIAEERGYVLAGVLGYRAYAGYNNPFRIQQVSAGPRQNAKGGAADNTPLDRARSEQDVLNVAALVAAEYNTDPDRVYLMGNLMGAGGTWYLGQKYPEKWAAISPSNGPVQPDAYPYERLKNVPVAVVHGEPNTGTSGAAALEMVGHLRDQGSDVLWLSVPEADHMTAWTHVVPQVFDFFAAHRRAQ